MNKFQVLITFYNFMKKICNKIVFLSQRPNLNWKIHKLLLYFTVKRNLWLKFMWFKNIWISIYNLKIFTTLLVGISTVERSFTPLQRINTYLWNTMGQSRLNGLVNIHKHREIEIKEFEVLTILSEKGKILNLKLICYNIVINIFII